MDLPVLFHSMKEKWFSRVRILQRDGLPTADQETC